MAPTTTLIPANPYEIGYWNNAPCSFTFTAQDNAGGSGVATTGDRPRRPGPGRRGAPGTVFTVPAPADHSGDGPHTFQVRSTDVAGNVESPQTFQLAIDTRRPTSQAHYAARVRRGSLATLRFKLLDAQPSYGSCQAVIVVKTLKGQRKLTLSPKPCVQVRQARLVPVPLQAATPGRTGSTSPPGTEPRTIRPRRPGTI